MIKDWRTHWDAGDFPFLIVQLRTSTRGSRSQAKAPSPAHARRKAKALTVPNTGMAVTIDIGEGNIHPPDKADVGRRLALVAEHNFYGMHDLVASGPTYKSFAVEGNQGARHVRQYAGALSSARRPSTITSPRNSLRRKAPLGNSKVRHRRLGPQICLGQSHDRRQLGRRVERTPCRLPSRCGMRGRTTPPATSIIRRACQRCHFARTTIRWASEARSPAAARRQRRAPCKPLTGFWSSSRCSSSWASGFIPSVMRRA